MRPLELQVVYQGVFRFPLPAQSQLLASHPDHKRQEHPTEDVNSGEGDRIKHFRDRSENGMFIGRYFYVLGRRSILAR